jgi:alpha-N-arabinofuranosidase
MKAYPESKESWLKGVVMFARPSHALTLEAVLVLVALAGPVDSAQQAPRPVATIDVTKTGAPIDPLFYGKFTELLGNMFEKGVWAEMISDRKFFYAVNSSKELTPRNTKRGFNRWWPVGPDSAITMDANNAYVGEHSPRIAIDASTPRGIIQRGIPIRKGREYTGRVILAGDAGAHVTVSLIWGTQASDRETITLGHLTEMYHTFPFRFTADADADSAEFEIVGTGAGWFRIGVVSLMPADNVNGFRRDIVEHLKVIDHGTVYRWPGGNMLAMYDWRDGVGDVDRRRPYYDLAWNTVEYNDVGTDEFIILCRLLGLTPFIVTNIGLHDEYSAAAWVEYCNGAPNTTCGSLRAANGHREPYGVRFWGIGNEMYGQWQIGHMSIDHYITKHIQFAKRMRAVDPTIKLIASGANIFETGTTNRHHRLRPDNMKLPFEYGSPEDWSGQLLARASDYFEIISEHVYPNFSNYYDVEKQAWMPVQEDPVDAIRRGTNRIHAVAEAYDHYMETIPGLKAKRITIALDEWAPRGPLGAAEGMMEIFRRTDIYGLGGYTGFSRCINHSAHETTYSPTGLVFRILREHYGTIPVSLTGHSPQKDVPGTVGVDKASTSSGSDTSPLDMTAALSADRRTLTVAVVNPTQTAQDVDLNLSGVTLGDAARAWQMVLPDYNAGNVPGQKPVVDIVEVPVKGAPSSLNVPPISVSVYAFAVR